ncbi:MAG TPA: CHRD domain-containing protein [Candidatus Nitrosocosmicus sp.]|nr:CHRD domain-containing protein [Candidatus Nitrosocosmicus sp.]
MLGVSILIVTLLSIVATATVFGSQTVFATTEMYSAQLDGQQEVPIAQTNANGTAQLSAPHNFPITYSLNVSGLDRVTAAHIHNGHPGENGPIVVTLFEADQPTGPIDGILAEGNITDANLEGPMQNKSTIELASAMLQGQTYINVHTQQNPNGEIRGQITGGD